MDAPFDRGEVDRASLDATERLRARLSARPLPAPRAPRRGLLPWAVAGSLFVFSAGMIANPWFETAVRDKLPFAGATTTAADSTELQVLRARLAKLETRSGPVAPMPFERLARTEAQIETSTDQIAREADRIDRLTSDVAALAATQAGSQARAEAATATAIAAADRAQGMLTLLLARRAIEAGRPFGALDAALRQSFEARYPDAVKSVAALGAAPVTLTALRRDFDRLSPSGTVRSAADTRQSWWDTLTGTIAAAVSRPAADTPATPYAAARSALLRGDHVAAANHLRRLPAPRAAALSAWLTASDRLQEGSAALATLENATVLSPSAPAVAVATSSPSVAPAPAPAATATPAPASPSAPATGTRISTGLDRLGRLPARLRMVLHPRNLFGGVASLAMF
ncbi:MAG: hypothetical protein ACOYLS_02355 [Polymorphobacter sp.]